MSNAAGDICARETKSLIGRSLYRAKITRAAMTDAFFGPTSGTETTVAASVAVDVKWLEPSAIAESGLNAIASFAADSGVVENDIAEINGKRYRVTSVKPKELCGAVTHFECGLQLERRSA